jgi:hypothetical protein
MRDGNLAGSLLLFIPHPPVLMTGKRPSVRLLLPMVKQFRATQTGKSDSQHNRDSNGSFQARLNLGLRPDADRYEKILCGAGRPNCNQ